MRQPTYFASSSIFFSCSRVYEPYWAPPCSYTTAQPARSISAEMHFPLKRKLGRMRGGRYGIATCGGHALARMVEGLEGSTYDTHVLVPAVELAIDGLPKNLVSQPLQALLIVFLRLLPKVRALGGVHARQTNMHRLLLQLFVRSQ